MAGKNEAKEIILTTGQTEYINSNTVHKEYGFSTSTLAKWRMNHLNLKFYRMGKYIRYKRSDIVAFIESNKVEVAS